MKKKLLGSTGIEVSLAGLGTFKFGRNQQIKYPRSFDLPTDNEILSLIAFSKELGINLIDTAPAYGTSEERLGRLLTDRGDWVICTKVGEEFIDIKSYYNFAPNYVRKSIERSLKRLRTDYLDIVLVHSNGDDQQILEENNCFEVLSELKTQGLVRAFGMSTKTVVGGLKTVAEADVVMVTYNPINSEEAPVIQEAERQNKGVLIKKAFASGHLDKISDTNPVQAAMDFILKESGVSSIILSTLSEKHLQQNVDAINQFS